MNKLFGLQQNLTRNILAWSLALSVTVFLSLLKPNVQVFERAMYLPLDSKRQAITEREVVVKNNNPFLYKKIGYITITLPYTSESDATTVKIVEQAKKMAANAGAEVLFLEGMRSSPWFDSGLKIFRLQAVAMSQS